MNVFAETSLQDLVAASSGPVLLPNNPGYHEEAAAFNVMHQASPAVVVGATNVDDVVAAVRYAAQTSTKVAVHATGHGLVDDRAGTVMICTRRMSSVVVDPDARTATIGAGTRWNSVIEAAAPFGLAPLAGSASHVGAIGYTLGGGIGPISRRYGYAADHVRSLTIVTADGAVRRVDDTHEADLFWALRGGKVGLGFVTEIEVDLMPVARFYGGGIFFPGADAHAVLHTWRTWAPTLPDDASTSIALLRLPPDPNLPPPLQGQFVVHVRFTHLGTAEEGAELVAPMREVSTPIMDLIDEMPFAALDAVHMDPTEPMPVWEGATTLSVLTADAVDAVLAQAGPDVDTSILLFEIRLLGGALAKPVGSANAVAGRDAAYGVLALGIHAGPEAGRTREHIGAVIGALKQWSTGGLTNFLGHGRSESDRGPHTEADQSRLREIMDRYDPDALFDTGVVRRISAGRTT